MICSFVSDKRIKLLIQWRWKYLISWVVYATEWESFCASLHDCIQICQKKKRPPRGNTFFSFAVFLNEKEVRSRHLAMQPGNKRLSLKHTLFQTINNRAAISDTEDTHAHTMLNNEFFPKHKSSHREKERNNNKNNENCAYSQFLYKIFCKQFFIQILLLLWSYKTLAQMSTSSSV